MDTYWYGYSEYGMEEAIRGLETSEPELFELFEKRLTNQIKSFIRNLRRNFSAELNIDDANIRVEYPHQGQSGLADFIDQGVEQKFLNMVKNLFFRQKEEENSRADFFDEEDDSSVMLSPVQEIASDHEEEEEEFFESTYDEEEEEKDLASLINLEDLNPSQNSLITAVLRECEEDKTSIGMTKTEIPLINLVTEEKDKNLIEPKSALSQEIDHNVEAFFAELNLKMRKKIAVLDDKLVNNNNKFIIFGKIPKIQ
ncbi:uncharacterized protein LOC141537111 [Cotesia typhae]|uniref:uncharacterized protein LOC141537111 n=1 Tax=Cotesia typhae TaxID=2053667 RepID=UPI003D697D36